METPTTVNRPKQEPILTSKAFLDLCTSLNTKPCRTYIRGCRQQLASDSVFRSCEPCRIKERTKEKKKREEAAKMNEEAIAALAATERVCTICSKVQPLEAFEGLRDKTKLTKTCKTCRDRNHVQNVKRDMDHRNKLARINEAKPERKLVKKAWKEKNYAKVVLASTNFRQRQMEKNGVEGYLSKNAESAKAWRDKNPEKVASNNIKRNGDILASYRIYGRTAELKSVDFQLSFEDFQSIVHQPCYFCGDMNMEKQFVGIDRRVPEQGYVLSNCLPCCEMCNYMKRSLSDTVFLLRVEHIIVYQNLHNNEPTSSEESNDVSFTLHPDIFSDHHRGGKYAEYAYRASSRGVAFTIDEDAFEVMRHQACYICGKQNTRSHQNGIDRFDNTIGYEPDNCRPCCGECNYLKNAYVYQDLIDKLVKIFNHRIVSLHQQKNAAAAAATPATVNDAIIPNKASSSKKTKEDTKLHAAERKRKSRALLLEKYADEEYKLSHAKEVAEQRSFKKATL